MNCPNCGKENDDGNWVCGHCGETFAASRSSKPESPPRFQPDGTAGVIIKLLVLAIIVAAAGAAVWYFHFRGPDTSTPTGTMQAYVNAISDGDYEKFFELTPNRLVPANRENMNIACDNFTVISVVNIKDYKPLEKKIDGDTAK